MSLALCVGVAFLLLAGSAFAQTGVTAIAGGQVDVVATQVAKTNQIYVIPAGLGTVTRTMGVARQQSSGNFFLVVTLPTGFTFNDPSTIGTNLPAAGDLILTSPAPQATYVTAITVFSGGTAGATFVKYLVQMAADFTSAATFSLDTQLWGVKDANAGGSLNAVGNTTLLTVQTFDANFNTLFDSGTDSATWIRAANGVTATVTATTAVIDVASLRKNFAANGTDTATIDKDATVNVSYPAGVRNADGTLYTLAAADKLRLTFTGTGDGLSGVSATTWSSGGTVQANLAGNPGVIEVLGNNGALPANGATASVPVTITVNGTTALTTRTITISVDTVISANAAQSTNLVPATTTYSVWGINGSVLLANWASANTTAYKSRFYIFNESATNNAQVLIRIFQIPISANATAGIQIGNTVTLSKTLGTASGMTIRLEDVLTASGATADQMAGPDGSYNVAVEITVYAPQTSGSVIGGVTGYTQTFNMSASMAFGTTPLSRIQ